MTTIMHDDTDGEIQELTVTPGPDGDMWIIMCGKSYRYRTMIGGGMYPRTYFALKELQKAMQQDLEDISGGQSHIDRWVMALEDDGQ